MTSVSLRRTVAALLLVAPGGAVAQSDYYKTDAGRPVRVEDAEATERYALGLQLPPVRAERALSGGTRTRFEPKLSYGILPRTELEVRGTMLLVPRQGNVPARIGVSGVGVSMLHAFTIETPEHPAIAVAADAVLPFGSLASPRPTFSGKAMLTRTFRTVRVHVNGAFGTWSVGPQPPPVVCEPDADGEEPASCPDNPPPIIPDTPCNVAPTPPAGAAAFDAPRSRLCAAPNAIAPNATAPTAVAPNASAAARQAALPGARYGRRWFIGAAADHAFAVRSVLVSADAYAEWFEELYGRPDIAAEIGARHQLTPNVVLDLGVGRRFAGVNPATLGTLGLTFTIAARPLVR